MKEILILYFSKYGATELLAREIANGVDSVEGVSSKIRTVPSIPISNKKIDDIPDQGPPYIEKQDLFDCDGLILGSPCRFGNMAAELKYFLDNTTNEWINNALSEKPAGVFTSSGSMHGGQESTLLTMAIPLLHHGMLLTGIPFSEKELSTTREGGTPYGPSHVSDEKTRKILSPDEVSLTRALGKRISRIAKQLN